MHNFVLQCEKECRGVIKFASIINNDSPPYSNHRYSFDLYLIIKYVNRKVTVTPKSDDFRVLDITRMSLGQLNWHRNNKLTTGVTKPVHSNKHRVVSQHLERRTSLAKRLQYFCIYSFLLFFKQSVTLIKHNFQLHLLLTRWLNSNKFFHIEARVILWD